MDTLQRALVEKAGNDNGFEYVLPAAPATVELGSARHKAHVAIEPAPVSGFSVRLSAVNRALGNLDLEQINHQRRCNSLNTGVSYIVGK